MTEDQFRRLMLMLEAIHMLISADSTPFTSVGKEMYMRSFSMVKHALAEQTLDEDAIQARAFWGEDIDEPIVDAMEA